MFPCSFCRLLYSCWHRSSSAVWLVAQLVSARRERKRLLLRLAVSSRTHQSGTTLVTSCQWQNDKLAPRPGSFCCEVNSNEHCAANCCGNTFLRATSMCASSNISSVCWATALCTVCPFRYRSYCCIDLKAVAIFLWQVSLGECKVQLFFFFQNVCSSSRKLGNGWG